VNATALLARAAPPSHHPQESNMNTEMFDYTTVLATLQQIAPEAHIAGGAVRDTVLQKQIHDIDMFMKDEHVEEAAALLRSHCSYVKVVEWTQYLDFSDPAMTSVAKFEKADETIPVCIIGLLPQFASPEVNIARFDFGICMAAFDGKRTMRAAEFDQDEKAHTFTLCRADSQAQFTYSLSRFEKITAARYAGWSLVVPHEFGRRSPKSIPSGVIGIGTSSKASTAKVF
jgi:hypothetical protein